MSQQYHDLCQHIIDSRTDVPNERTGKICHVGELSQRFSYDLSDAVFENGIFSSSLEMVTTRVTNVLPAIGEILGYLQGLDNANDFAKLLCNTWFKNADENEVWLASPYRKGPGDIGRAYGVQGRDWTNQDGESFDQLQKIIDDLSRGYDDRGEILLFHNPGEVHMACLRACMFLHIFGGLPNGKPHPFNPENQQLDLTLLSVQRSVDVPLGLVFNMVQVQVALIVMALATGNMPRKGDHDLMNCHIYEDQIDIMIAKQMPRKPQGKATLTIDTNKPSLKGKRGMDFIMALRPEDFEITNYFPDTGIIYPFSV